MFRAVVFAYSEVGFRCLRALLDHDVDVPLVLTHEDAAGEHTWFGSVAKLAAERRVEVVTPRDPNEGDWPERIAALAPHYLLSFYYRSMLGDAVRASARWGALNMHGSLLPKYRGRAPVNWAILNGETDTGATLHHMVQKADAGPVVDQETVPIGMDDTALVVSRAVAGAAERLLIRCLPQLAAGPPAGKPMDLTQGSYFGSRKPEDGRIDWSQPAARVHALIRAVAPPFPGAFTDVDSHRLLFAASHWTGAATAHPRAAPCLYCDSDDRFHLDCADGLRLSIPSLAIDGHPAGAEDFRRLFGERPLRLMEHSIETPGAAREKARR